eukprot:6597677-Pyramimonas_sp.AAC.1
MCIRDSFHAIEGLKDSRVLIWKISSTATRLSRCSSPYYHPRQHSAPDGRLLLPAPGVQGFW